MTTSDAPQLPQWGRILIAGGTDWANLGRKGPGGQKLANESAPDLPTPHILRALSNVRMTRAISSHSSSHSVFLSINGDAYIMGRNEVAQCGFPATASSSIIPSGSVIAVPTKLSRSSHFHPSLPSGLDGDIVAGATGRSHTLLVTRSGLVYAAGSNSVGQCGDPRQGQNISQFTQIRSGPFIKDKDPVVKVSAGVTFSVLVTKSGKVYALGSCEKGQLGNGKTGEHFITGSKTAFETHSEPLVVRGPLEEKKIVDVACGQSHTVVLDSEGLVYTWGFGGHGRLGVGQQQDQLLPVLVPQFARENKLMRATKIYAGATCSAAIDGQKMFWLTGKWKTSGDGGSGSGWMSYKFLPELMGTKVRLAGLGGVTLTCIADEDPKYATDFDATMNIVWGQGAHNGELGLGYDQPRSATKPIRCAPIDGLSILDVACGQNTMFYVARNLGPVYSELPRFPEAVDSRDTCVGCGSDATTPELLECEKCENPWHITCLDPPLEGVPEGEWHCPDCRREGGEPDDVGEKAAEDESTPDNSAAVPKKRGRPSKADTAARKKAKA